MFLTEKMGSEFDHAKKKLPAPREFQVEEKKVGFFNRLLGRKSNKGIIRRALNDEMVESLEELLITSDMGVETSLRVTSNMVSGRFGKKLSTNEIKELLSNEIANILEPVAKPMPI